jgi:hypothetical protein
MFKQLIIKQLNALCLSSSVPNFRLSVEVFYKQRGNKISISAELITEYSRLTPLTYDFHDVLKV